MTSADILKQLKIPGLAREAIYFLVGFLLLLFLNIIYHPNLEVLPNIDRLNGFGFGVAIFSLSYLLGRVCKELGNIILSVLTFLLRNERIINVRSLLKEISNYINQKTAKIGNSKSITIAEINNFIHKNDGLSFLFERDIQHIILLETTLGACVILAITYNDRFYIVVLLLAIYCLIIKVGIWQNQIEIAEYMRECKKDESAGRF